MELTRQGKVALVLLGIIGGFVLWSRLREGGAPQKPAGGDARVPDARMATPNEPSIEDASPHLDRARRDAIRARIEALNAPAQADDSGFDFAASRNATPVGLAVPFGPSIANKPLGQ